jgi:hypothetical protein
MWNFTKVYWQQTFYNASVESAQDAERRQEGGAGQGVRAGRVGKQKEFGQGDNFPIHLGYSPNLNIVLKSVSKQV